MALATRWWSRKYNRPVDDPLVLDLNEALIWEEMLTDLFVERAALTRALSEPLREDRGALMKQLESVEAILYPKHSTAQNSITGDPILDKLALGRITKRAVTLEQILPATLAAEIQKRLQAGKLASEKYKTHGLYHGG